MSYSRRGQQPNFGAQIAQAFMPAFAPPSLAEIGSAQAMQLRSEEAARKQAALAEVARLYGPEAAAIAGAGEGANLQRFERVRLARGRDPNQQIDLTYDNFGNSPTGTREALRSQEARTGMETRGRVAVAALNPLGPNQYRPGAPSLASMFGMPELAQPQQGNLALNPGETIVTPGGQTFSGLDNRAPRNVLVQGPGGATRTAITRDGVTDLAGRPLVGPGESLTETYDNFGNTREGLGIIERGRADRAALEVRGRLVGDAARAIPQDSFRPAVPSAADLGVPELAQPQQGNLTLRQGETVITPDGQRVAGGPAQPNRAPTNVIIQGPDGTAVRTAVTYDGVNDTLGQPLVQNPGERIASTFSVQGTNARDVTGPTNTNITQANSIQAELATGGELIGAVRSIMRDNPGIFGIPGMVRGLAQDLQQTLVETMQAFGQDRPEMQRTAQNIQEGLARVAPEYYNPSIPKARRLLYELAYFSARLNDPNGEVSREELNRNLEFMAPGGLANSARVEATLQAIETSMGARRRGMETLRNPGGAAPSVIPRPPAPAAPAAPAAAAPAAPAAAAPAAGVPTIPGPGGVGVASPPDAGVERWGRGPDGRLQRLQ